MEITYHKRKREEDEEEVRKRQNQGLYKGRHQKHRRRVETIAKEYECVYSRYHDTVLLIDGIACSRLGVNIYKDTLAFVIKRFFADPFLPLCLPFQGYIQSLYSSLGRFDISTLQVPGIVIPFLVYFDKTGCEILFKPYPGSRFEILHNETYIKKEIVCESCPVKPERTILNNYKLLSVMFIIRLQKYLAPELLETYTKYFDYKLDDLVMQFIKYIQSGDTVNLYVISAWLTRKAELELDLLLANLNFRSLVYNVCIGNSHYTEELMCIAELQEQYSADLKTLISPCLPEFPIVVIEVIVLYVVDTADNVLWPFQYQNSRLNEVTLPYHPGFGDLISDTRVVQNLKSQIQHEDVDKLLESVNAFYSDKAKSSSK